MLEQLERTGEDQISLTDPDSRAMAAHRRVAMGYNAQIAVDVKHKLIVEQQVTNQVVDMCLLTQTAEPAKEVLGVEKIDVVADKGYLKIEDIDACEKTGIGPYVPRPQGGPLPQGRIPIRRNHGRLCLPGWSASSPLFIVASAGLKKVNYVNNLACDDCSIRSQCTGGTFRTVSRLENEAVVLDRLAARPSGEAAWGSRSPARNG
jgi:hypothetical protein